MNNSNDSSFSVLIPDAESWLAYPVISCLASMPHVKIVALSNTANNPIRLSRHVKQFFSRAYRNEAEQLAAIDDVVKTTKIDIILPIDNQAIRLLSLHKAHFQDVVKIAWTPSVEAFDIAASKWQLANWLQKQQIPCPTTLIFQAGSAFEQTFETLAFPVLLKPTQQIGDDVGVGGRGIQIFEKPSDLLAFSKINSVVEYIVQPFIKGYDIGCNVLCQEGKIIAYTIQKGFMASQRRFEPAVGIDFLHDAAAYEVVQSVVTALKWTGVANFDLRYDEDDKQIKVLEINPRFWASVLGSNRASVNFPYLACLAGLGKPLLANDYQSIRYINAKAWSKILLHRFIDKKSSNKNFDGSELDFIIKDPLPKLLGFVLKKYKQWQNNVGGS